MSVAVTGATGLVGHTIARHLQGLGHDVTALGRRPAVLPGVVHRAYDLTGPLPDLSGVDAIVHAAFQHVPGRYRGGEGHDPAGFVRANGDATARLFHHARTAGVQRIIFVSSRAVYDGYPPGTALTEDLPPRADSLYGQTKIAAEGVLQGLSRQGMAVASLRATGVYGVSAPGRPQKWEALFASFAAGTTPPPRTATEVHGVDLAEAVHLLLRADAAKLGQVVFNASDLLVDHRDLLAIHAQVTGCATPLPRRSDPASVNIMPPGRLAAMGWTPRGQAGLTAAVRDMVLSPSDGV